MFGVLYEKRFGSEMAWAIRKEGYKVGGGPEYRNKLWRVTTHMQAMACMWVVTLHSLFLYSDPPPTL